MSSTPTTNPERIDQLMVDAATQGLSPQDQAELDTALQADPVLHAELDAYEMAATSIEMGLAKTNRAEALPPGLRERLLASAAEQQAALSSATLKLTNNAPQAAKANDEKPAFSFTDGRYFGWYAAAAATIALCVLLVQPPQKEIVNVQKVVTKEVPVEVERIVKVPAEQAPERPITDRYALLSSEPQTVSAKWGFNADGGDPRFVNTTGEVIWNSNEQTGYMKLAGLPVNDPTKEQYQLWLVDSTRNGESTDRIDGGVFNITEAGEIIISIDAKIVARQPVVFAITVESPGGVVESKGPLQIVAAVENAI